MGEAEAAPPGHRLKGRLLVCAAPAQLPPFHGGGAQVLGRLLRPIAADDYLLAGFGRDPAEPAVVAKLTARAHRFASGWSPIDRASPYPLAGVRAVRLFMAEGLRRGRLLAALAAREGCSALLVTTNATPDFIAGIVAARRARIPLILYLFDDWRHMMAIVHPAIGRLAALLEPWLVRYAAATLVISPLLAEEMERDYGVKADLVSHPLPEGLAIDAAPPERPWPLEPGQLRIVFTGRVYDAHYDALVNVLRALERPGLEHVSLHIYGASASQEQLERRGLRGRMVVHPAVSAAELREVQRDADILLLPLGFNTPYPEVVRTALPTKAAEYLAVGRPILIHAPADSYLAALAARDGVAASVVTPDPTKLAAAIQRIASDADYRSTLVRAARWAAAAYHGPKVTQDRFRAVVDRVMAGAAGPARE